MLRRSGNRPGCPDRISCRSPRDECKAAIDLYDGEHHESSRGDMRSPAQEGAMSPLDRYAELCASHRWNVPARYNLAADVCDRHPRDKPAMVWESFDGSRRQLAWGELQDMANQAAHTLAGHGIGRGDRVAVVLPPSPETAAVFFGVWKLGAILLSLSVLYGDEAIRHRLDDSEARLVVTDESNAQRFPGREVLLLDADELAHASIEHVCADTA